MVRDKSALRKLTNLILWLFLLVAAPSFLFAQSLSENQKIEALIKQVGDLKDAKFIRNGSTYEVPTAVRFLRRQWDGNVAEVKSARDLIDKVASVSGTSGKPYLIRFKDGSELKSREFLLAELRKIEPYPLACFSNRESSFARLLEIPPTNKELLFLRNVK